MAEYSAREAVGLAWIDEVFDRAEKSQATAMLLGMQADMWDPTAQQSAFVPFKEKIAARAERFGKPVLLFEGDPKKDGVFSCEVIPFGGTPKACPAPLAG